MVFAGAVIILVLSKSAKYTIEYYSNTIASMKSFISIFKTNIKKIMPAHYFLSYMSSLIIYVFILCSCCVFYIFKLFLVFNVLYFNKAAACLVSSCLLEIMLTKLIQIDFLRTQCSPNSIFINIIFLIESICTSCSS